MTALPPIMPDVRDDPWCFLVTGHLWTTNGERTLYRHKRSELTRYWRAAFQKVALDAEVPHLERVRIVAQPWQHLGRLGDAGGHIPVVKAAVDGLRDAGVLTDDDGRYVTEIICRAPLRGTVESLTLELWVVE